MSSIFHYSEFNNYSIKYWNISNVEYVKCMFYNSKINYLELNWNFNKANDIDEILNRS